MGKYSKYAENKRGGSITKGGKKKDRMGKLARLRRDRENGGLFRTL